MAVRVLVVDDSRFFRRRVTEILAADSQIEVVGTAENGLEAIDLVAKIKPDVVTMDIEMPVMDGITAVRRIMSTYPTPILMFSSLTTEGAQATLDALDAGAVDFLPKRFEDISTNKEEAKRLLCAKVVEVGSGGTRRRRVRSQPVNAAGAATPPATPVRAQASPRSTPSLARGGDLTKVRPGAVASAPAPAAPALPASSAPARSAMPPGWLRNFGVVAIGSSTGGPVALQEVLTKLPSDFPLPIILVQHMPSTFTAAFADRLDKLCRVRVKEAADGDRLTPGQALLAPGGSQMVFEKRGPSLFVRIKEATAGQNYKPCVDITFSAMAKLMPGKVVAIVLTGMGADGREGCRELKRDHSTIWAQSQETCVVWGMPGAVVEAGIADQVLSPAEVGARLAQGV